MSDGATVKLDEGLCRAYGICVSILPDVFDIPAGGRTATLLRSDVDADDVEDLEEAARACPARAISLASASAS